MRITRETLLKIARDTAVERIRVSRRLVCIYLTGSVLADEPLLGGTSDIDLVCIHDSEPLEEREVVRLTDEISLDICHYPQDRFHQPRHLRTDAWLGPFIYAKPLLLHDTAHWFEFTQASTGAQFFQPDNVLARARSLAEAARQRWMKLNFNQSDEHPRRVYSYLKILEDSTNAIASLTGAPLTERRFLQQFSQRAISLQRPELAESLANLLAGQVSVEDAAWHSWLVDWDAAYNAVSRLPGCPVRLHPARKEYYKQAAAALWTDTPTAAFWVLLRTWTLAAAHLPAESEYRSNWNQVCQTVGLDETGLPVRLDSLDHYLDAVEETLDSWAIHNGVISTP